jgi:hypothetical protein
MTDTEMKEVHGRLKYVLDLMTFEDRIYGTEHAHLREVLQFALWQVGMASGGVLVLVALSERWLIAGDLLSVVSFGVAFSAFVKCILHVCILYMAHLAADAGKHAERVSHATRLVDVMHPQGIGGGYSTEQKKWAEEASRRLEELRSSAAAIHTDIRKRLRSASLWLGAGYITLIYVVMSQPVAALVNATFDAIMRLLSRLS